MYDSGLQELNPSSADSVHVWLNKITLAVLPKECSRHNTPSRAHAISKLVKDNSSKSNEFHIVVTIFLFFYIIQHVTDNDKRVYENRYHFYFRVSIS